MSTTTQLPCGPAPPEVVYTNIPTTLASVQAYAKGHGYAFHIRDTRPKKVIFACDCGGKYQSKGKKNDLHK